MNFVSTPNQHLVRDGHQSPIPSIKTLSPTSSPHKYSNSSSGNNMAKSTSIVITSSTSDECSPTHSYDGDYDNNKHLKQKQQEQQQQQQQQQQQEQQQKQQQQNPLHLHQQITNAFQIITSSTHVSTIPTSSAATSQTTPEFILSDNKTITLTDHPTHHNTTTTTTNTTSNDKPTCKTISYNGSWRPFRRDKVTPLKVEDTGPIIHRYPSPFSVLNLESTHQHSFGNTSTDSHQDDCCPDLIPKCHSNAPSTGNNVASSSPHSNHSSISKNHVLPRQGTLITGDNSVYPFNPNNHNTDSATITTQASSTIGNNKSDVYTIHRGSSELGFLDLRHLSVPQHGSWKSMDDSMTISTIQGPISATGSMMSVSRSLESKMKMGPSEPSNFIFQNSPISSTRRNLSQDEFDRKGEPSTLCCNITNLSTTQGRQWNAAMILALSVAPIIALLIQNCINLHRNNDVYEGQQSIKSDILYSVEIGNVMHFTQIERGTTVLYVSTNGNDLKVNQNLLRAYNNTDRAIGQLSKWLSENDPAHFRTEKAYWDRMKQFRKDVWRGLRMNVDEVLKFYSDDNAVIERWIGKSVQLSTSGDIWRTLIGYYMLIISKEQAGVERALGGSFYAEGGFTNARMQHYIQRKVTGQNFLARSEEYVPEVGNYLDLEYRGTTLAVDLKDMRDEILMNSESGPDADKGLSWFEDMTTYINLLKVLQDRLANGVVSELNADIEELRSKVVEATAMIVISLLLFPFVIITVYRLTKRIQAYAEKLHERSVDLELERKRSELLLYELLPQQVAQKLLSSEEVAPMPYKDVTIFFSDIVGFTSICSRSTPMQVIDMLNSLYRIFDDILSSYRVYKVETIGDAYMVASGVPDENKQHAPEIAGVALDMRDSMSHIMVNHMPDEKLQLRIGINSGPVVAGVVGNKMPRYCLFGDTVNVASRMESTSLPLQIQISESTRRELDKWGCFEITPRGKVEIKGKGMMQTHWLVGRDLDADSKRLFKQQSQSNDIIYLDEEKIC